MQLETVGRMMLLAGGVLALTGVFLLLAGRVPGLPLLGRLPGDFLVQRGNFSFYFPLASSLVLSIILTLLLNLVLRVLHR